MAHIFCNPVWGLHGPNGNKLSQPLHQSLLKRMKKANPMAALLLPRVQNIILDTDSSPYTSVLSGPNLSLRPLSARVWLSLRLIPGVAPPHPTNPAELLGRDVNMCPVA